MTDLWSLHLKPGTSAAFTPRRTLKLTNACLGVDVSEEPGRTVVLLMQDLSFGESDLASSESAPSVPIFSLTSNQDEHKCLDIVLTNERKYTFLARGPNDIHLFGYFLSAMTAVSSAETASSRGAVDTSVPTTAVTASTSVITSGSSASSNQSLKRKGSGSIQGGETDKKKKTDYFYRDLKTGPDTNKLAVRSSVVTVDLKATFKSSDKKTHILFEESNVKLVLDGGKERGWKMSITGMRAGGQRVIKVPAHLATGDVEQKIHQEFFVEVCLCRVNRA